MVCTPGSTPYFSYEAFAGLKHYTPFCAQDFHPGGLCKWRAPPVLPRTSVMRLLRVWSIIPLFMHKISTQVVCVNGEHPPVLPRTSVLRLLRVWSIIPLFMHKISSRVVCVNGEHPPVLPRTSVLRLLRVWSIIPLFMHKISTRVVCVNGKCLCCLVLPFFRRNGRYLISVTADNAINRNEASIYIAIIDDPKWSAPEVTIYGPHKTSVSGNHKAAIVDQ